MRYVIGPDVALRLLREKVLVPAPTRLVAPTVLRSQVLSGLYAAVRRGDLDRAEARSQLNRLPSLSIRLLGDRVLQGLAWEFAEQLGWPDTLDAEYVALTRLQADAFVTLDPDLSRAVDGIVPVADFERMAGR